MIWKFRFWLAYKLIGKEARQSVAERAEHLYWSIWPKHPTYAEATRASLREALTVASFIKIHRGAKYD